MEDEILKSILIRSGTAGKEELLKDMIGDCISELKDIINYKDDEVLPAGCIAIVKELVLIKFNHDGVEGIQSESNSGVSTSYLVDIPPTLLRRMRKHRKLPGNNYVCE